MMKRRMLDQFLQRFAAAPDVGPLVEAAVRGDDNLVVSEIRGGAAPALLALLARRLTRPVLLITSSLERAEALADGLCFFGADSLLFPNFDTLPFEHGEPVLHITAARHRVLARLVHGDAKAAPPVIVAPVDSLAYRPLPREALLRQSVRIGWGQTLDLDKLAETLVAMGFKREALVESPGEFAIRGSIVDIYPPDAEHPWRLDLFGDEVEQIRQFDPTTQRSLNRQEENESIEILASAIQGPKLEHLKQGGELGDFFALLPADTLIVLDGPSRVRQRLRHFQDTADRHWADIHRAPQGEEPNPFVYHGFEASQWLLSESELLDAVERFRRIELATLSADVEDDPVETPPASPAPAPGDLKSQLEALKSGNPQPARKAQSQSKSDNPQSAIRNPQLKSPDLNFPIGTMSFETIPSQFPEYLGIIRDRLRKGHWIAVICDNNGQVMRLDELFREAEISAVILDKDVSRASLPAAPDAPCHDVLLMTGELHEGFQAPGAGLFMVTDREIFGRYKRRHIYRKAFRGRAIANPAEIQRGDYVVHMQHGIGVFERIRRQEVDGRMAEFIELTYQDGDKLLVPVEKLHLVQKYASADGKVPTLDKLGSKKWQSRCKKTMEAVRKMAGELLELYARRAAAEGFAYGPDNAWQQEFEASFIYQETPDQLKAIQEVKKDMASPRPMDRLVCGDVGYGKTEVAIRAAFKALTEGRQVAVLAPTTLLVQQHFSTFTERFADYPFKVDVLSRFRSPKEQKDSLKRLEEGEVGLIVGTHRLLSRDVKFKDLGLLIVDEEQRFGVAQKEKIKSLRSSVDILTLTATPIPRTLYMSLSGLRDLSIINTPPTGRHPIKTRTIHWDNEVIEEAILRELNRGGQVFFIHNRIESIQEVSKRLKEIVPRARLVVAHGQMEEEELEKIMIDFISGKFDILISTTIIENGIDIPNVNTIIINRADTFGLAQLYQLRGRVGRDVRQAYAYLILPPGQGITPTAIKRLEALEEFTELGVGFSIAMRDMEIRGTGNILGREQHGAITDVGFEMYCRLLEDAVRDMKGQEHLEPIHPTEVRWPVDQFLPEEFIPIESQRIRFYKDLAAARDKQDLDLLLEELIDRYGQLSQPAMNLVNAARVKVAAARWRVDTLRPGPDDTVRLNTPAFSTEMAVALAEQAAAGREVFGRLRRAGEQLILHVRDDRDDEFTPEQILSALADYLEALPDPDPAKAKGALRPARAWYDGDEE